ncbi:cold-shock protein [Nocardia sp. NBC_01503]|uniref:cold-shock protein n=1 Tax=Nocardia sp. NBC_01503 TaxID=2975997 RepID=UPI003FA5B53F
MTTIATADEFDLTDPHAHTREHELPRWQHARVAWFDAGKGFGFLTPDTGSAVFVDFSVIEVPGYKTLSAGQPVIYTALNTPRGPEATRVVPYPRSSAGPAPRYVAPCAATRRSRCRARYRAA